jgi:hypothetical protein
MLNISVFLKTSNEKNTLKPKVSETPETFDNFLYTYAAS